jgi:hypothetical protein
MFGKFAIVIAELVEATLGQVLKIEQGILSTQIGTDEFIDLDLQGLGIAVLRILDDEDHQKGDDRRGRVDGKLPHIRKAKKRPTQRPGNDEQECDRKRYGTSGLPCYPGCGSCEFDLQGLAHRLPVIGRTIMIVQTGLPLAVPPGIIGEFGRVPQLLFADRGSVPINPGVIRKR